MRLSTLFCSVVFIIQGIDALPEGGRNPNPHRYQRRARFRRRQHWGPPQGIRLDDRPLPPPVAVPPGLEGFPSPGSAQSNELPALEQPLEGGPVSGLNFLPGYDGNSNTGTAAGTATATATATGIGIGAVAVLDITTTFDANANAGPTTPCITTVTQTVDITVLITASRPRPRLSRPSVLLPGPPPPPLATAASFPPPNYQLVPSPLPSPSLTLYPHPRPHFHPYPHPQPQPQPEFEPLPLPEPQPEPAPLPAITEPCPEDEVTGGEGGNPKTLNFMIVPVPVPAITPAPPGVAISTPCPEDTPGPITSINVDIRYDHPPAAVEIPPAPTTPISESESESVNALWEAFWPGYKEAGKRNAAAETASGTPTNLKKRDVDCDEDDNDNDSKGEPTFGGDFNDGPKIIPLLNGNGKGNGHEGHGHGDGDGLLTMTETRTIHHFQVGTPPVIGEDDDRELIPHVLPHDNLPGLPNLPLPLPHPPLPLPPVAHPIVTAPPRSPVRRPDPHLEFVPVPVPVPEPVPESLPELEVGPQLQFVPIQGQEQQNPKIQEHGFPGNEVEIRTTLCADDLQPNPTALTPSHEEGGLGPKPHRHIHCAVKDIHLSWLPAPVPVPTHWPHRGPGTGGFQVHPHPHARPPMAHRGGGGPGSWGTGSRLGKLRLRHKRDHNSAEGIHEIATGNEFLIDRFVEEAPGVSVSLGTCYEWCLATQGQPNGCKSYAYYFPRPYPHQSEINHLNRRTENHGVQGDRRPDDGPGDTARPRCDLFSEEVSYIFATASAAPGPGPGHVPHGPSTGGGGDEHPSGVHSSWFDLECGSPLDERWKPEVLGA